MNHFKAVLLQIRQKTVEIMPMALAGLRTFPFSLAPSWIDNRDRVWTVGHKYRVYSFSAVGHY